MKKLEWALGIFCEKRLNLTVDFWSKLIRKFIDFPHTNEEFFSIKSPRNPLIEVFYRTNSFIINKCTPNKHPNKFSHSKLQSNESQSANFLLQTITKHRETQFSIITNCSIINQYQSIATCDSFEMNTAQNTQQKKTLK